MDADAPPPPGRHEALENAGRAVRDTRGGDRDAILAAGRSLRGAERAHDLAVRAAERRLATLRRETAGSDAIRAAEEALAAARSERVGMAAARPVLDATAGRLDDGETVLDMMPGISAGHDGVLVATDRRLLFVAPRRTLSFPYASVTRVEVHGRHFGARATISSAGKKAVIAGLRPQRAAELEALVRDRVDAPAGR